MIKWLNKYCKILFAIHMKIYVNTYVYMEAYEIETKQALKIPVNCTVTNFR